MVRTEKIVVVGAGLMASQLALLFARRLQVPVVLTDLDQARVDKGVAYVHTEVDKLLAKNRIAVGDAARVKALVSGDTDKFRQSLVERAEEFAAFAKQSQAAGAIHHRFGIGDGFVTVVDEWETPHQFEAFFTISAVRIASHISIGGIGGI